MTEEERREKVKRDIEEGLEALAQRIEEIKRDREKALAAVEQATATVKSMIADIDEALNETEEGNNGNGKEI